MAPTIQSPLPTMAPTATPKGMSSRLMTMKFMQRGEASAKSSPSTTPKTDSEGSAKRRKTAHKETPEAKPLYDEKAVQAALEEEESKRQAAIARRAKELGDEQWVLTGAAMSVPNARHPVNLNYVQVGFAQIDAGLPSDDDDDIPAASNVTRLAGRRQFNMKKAKKAAVKTENESDSDSSDSDNESGSDSSSSEEEQDRGRQSEGTPSGNRKRPSHSVSKRREAERLRAQELAEKRRKKEVKLNSLRSLSSGGTPASAFGNGSSASSMKCYNCGQTGHSKAKCPSLKRSR